MKSSANSILSNIHYNTDRWRQQSDNGFSFKSNGETSSLSKCSFCRVLGKRLRDLNSNSSKALLQILYLQDISMNQKSYITSTQVLATLEVFPVHVYKQQTNISYVCFLGLKREKYFLTKFVSVNFKYIFIFQCVLSIGSSIFRRRRLATPKY